MAAACPSPFTLVGDSYVVPFWFCIIKIEPPRNCCFSEPPAQPYILTSVVASLWQSRRYPSFGRGLGHSEFFDNCTTPTSAAKVRRLTGYPRPHTTIQLLTVTNAWSVHDLALKVELKANNTLHAAFLHYEPSFHFGPMPPIWVFGLETPKRLKWLLLAGLR